MKLLEIQLTEELGAEISAFLLENAPKLVAGEMQTPELVQREFTRLRHEATRVTAKLFLLIMGRSHRPLDLDLQAVCEAFRLTFEKQFAPDFRVKKTNGAQPGQRSLTASHSPQRLAAGGEPISTQEV